MGKFAGAVLAETASLDWGLVWSTVVTGIVVVFLILIILILFLTLFGKIFKAFNDSKDRREREKLAAKAPKPSVPPTLSAALDPKPAEPELSDDDDYEDEDDEEIIAVIAAAIAAYGEAEGKQYRIASVKRQKNHRSGWSSAGIADNMRGFYN